MAIAILAIALAQCTPSTSASSTKEILNVAGTGDGVGTVSADVGGLSCQLSSAVASGTCVVEVDRGTVATLTASATGGSSFAGWTGSCSGTATCVVTVNTTTNVQAIFMAPVVVTHTVTITAGGSGSGNVISTPAGLNCTAAAGTTTGNCTAIFVDGTPLSLVATPGAQQFFAGWTGACVSSTTSCALIVNSNLATQVSFLAPRTLTVTGGGAGAGTVTSLPAGTSCSIGAGVATGTCAVAYADATSVTLTAAASAGSTFTGWSGACTGVTCLVAMTTARSVTATFTGSSSVSQSTVTSSPASIVAGGAAATITVTVRDAGGNPLSGNAVTLTATGPGTLSIVQPLASTNASGVATGSVSGNVAGAYSVIARINGTSTIAQQATVTVSAGAANNITQFGTFASTGARFGQGVATLPAVVLRDAFANPVSGVTVTFSVDKGLATIGNGVTTSGSTVGVVTDASGVAQLASWTLSSVNSAGNYSPTIDVNNMVRATTAGIATSVVFATAVDVSYAADIQTIWDKSTGVIKSCSASGCHAAGGFAPILVAPSRTALTSAYLSPGDSVTTNNSVNRLLYRLVSGAPIMPQGYTALPPNVIGIIRAYIKQGAPGN